MDGYALVSSLRAVVRPVPKVHPERCLENMHVASGCPTCRQACPTGAIDENPSIHSGVCMGCGLCAALCPAGVFTDKALAIDGLIARTKQALTREHSHLVYSCGFSDTDAGDTEISRGCVVSLTSAHLLVPLTLGAASVTVVIDSCHTCRAGTCLGYLDRSLEEARLCLRAAGDHDARLRVSGREAAHRERPATVSAGYSRMGRRDFISGIGRSLLARAARPPSTPSPSAAEGCGNEFRLALPGVLRALCAGGDGTALPDARLEGLYGSITIGKSCDGCARCAACCPTGALAAEGGTGTTSILFDSERCVGCGLCVLHCHEGCLRLSREAVLSRLIAGEVATLATVEHSYCEQCGKTIAAGEDHCRACDRDQAIAGFFESAYGARAEH